MDRGRQKVAEHMVRNKERLLYYIIFVRKLLQLPRSTATLLSH